MIKLHLFIAFSTIPFLSFSQFRGAYKKNDTVNVLTLSGLNLRQSPSVNSQLVTKVPYSSKVQVIDDSLRIVPYKVEEPKGFVIEGFWVKVKFKDQIGYLFDGYLSRFPAFPYKDTAFYDEGIVLHFLKSHFKTIAKRKNLKKYLDCKVTKDNNCICAFEEKFENGITYSEDICTEEGASANVYKINRATLAEMYLFAKALSQFWQMGVEVSYDAKSKVINLDTTEDGAGCGGIIYIKNGVAIFEWGCSC